MEINEQEHKEEEANLQCYLRICIQNVEYVLSENRALPSTHDQRI